MSIDFYKILQIPRHATLPEIKNAYRKLALILHPDRNQSKANSASTSVQFIQVREAYDTLSDPVKRREYDQNLGYSSHHSHPQHSGQHHNRTYEHYAHKKSTPPSSHMNYNVAMWNAMHYGDGVQKSNVNFRNSYMNMPGNAHQAYYYRRNSSTNTTVSEDDPVHDIIKETNMRRKQRQEYDKAYKECCIS